MGSQRDLGRTLRLLGLVLLAAGLVLPAATQAVMALNLPAEVRQQQEVRDFMENAPGEWKGVSTPHPTATQEAMGAWQRLSGELAGLLLVPGVIALLWGGFLLRDTPEGRRTLWGLGIYTGGLLAFGLVDALLWDAISRSRLGMFWDDVALAATQTVALALLVWTPGSRVAASAAIASGVLHVGRGLLLITLPLAWMFDDPSPLWRMLPLLAGSAGLALAAGAFAAAAWSHVDARGPKPHPLQEAAT